MDHITGNLVGNRGDLSSDSARSLGCCALNGREVYGSAGDDDESLREIGLRC